MSQNPNMLRTMIGLGMTLIIILGYAVYSNTVDSEYYGYRTTNEHVELALSQDDPSNAEWYVTTNEGISWINATVIGAPVDSVLVVQSEGASWYHSPSLGEDVDYPFNCKEISGDYSEYIDVCEFSTTHELVIQEDESIMRGIVSISLPVEGLGYLQADDITEAEELAVELIDGEAGVITWRVGLYNEGEAIDSAGVEVFLNASTHEFVSIEEFNIDPVQESVYGMATLVGCFGLMLVIPLVIYFSAVHKAKKDEKVRMDAPDLNDG
tara:strand:- start:1620 stop:2420 length:801 start_codon:yes stop_codon:yes gene_type:complete